MPIDIICIDHGLLWPLTPCIFSFSPLGYGLVEIKENSRLICLVKILVTAKVEKESWDTFLKAHLYFFWLELILEENES